MATYSLLADAQRDAAQGLHLLLRAHIVSAPEILDDDYVVRGGGRGMRKILDADAVQRHPKLILIPALIVIPCPPVRSA